MHYLFVSEAEFDALIAEDALLEWAVVHGVHRYGTPRAPVLAALAAGRPALLEIDLQGARQVRGQLPGARLRLPGPTVLGGTRPPAGRSGHRTAAAAGAPTGDRRAELAAAPSSTTWS